MQSILLFWQSLHRLATRRLHGSRSVSPYSDLGKVNAPPVAIDSADDQIDALNAG